MAHCCLIKSRSKGKVEKVFYFCAADSSYLPQIKSNFKLWTEKLFSSALCNKNTEHHLNDY